MLQIHMIPALKDNYFWLIQPDTSSSEAYIVDPGSAQPVYDYLEQHKLQLKGILVTHHHHDHIDGVSELRDLYKIPVYGPKSARIPQVSNYLTELDQLELSPLTVQIIELPGHTLDHIAYLIDTPNGPPLLFSGDTLFAAGCGRLFDGTAVLLHAALKKIAELPNETLIYAGHEYTLANIRFALTIEPDNAELLNRQECETRKREEGFATLPTQLALEKQTNPFLRCHLPAIHTAVERISNKTLSNDVDVFTQLRLIKDHF